MNGVFRISITSGDLVINTTVEGELIMIAGIECGIHTEVENDVTWYNVTHLETGYRIAYDIDREAVIRKAERNLNKSSAKRLILEAKKHLRENNIKLPVNTFENSKYPQP